MKKKTSMTVLDSRQMAEGIYSLILAYPAGEAPRQVLPGQFAGIFPCDSSALLMRPISVCRWDPAEGSIRFVYRAAGRGTKNFTGLKTGDRVDMLGILGNGYEISRMRGKRVLLLGGGIGIPPMLELAAALKEEARSVTAVLGYRNRELFLADEFRREAKVLIATEDGSVGTEGNVLDAVRAAGIQADVICACGPMPMLRAVKKYAAGSGVPAYISLEERMACGVGACLGCVTKTAKVDEHSHVHNARICTEGPVFEAGEVEIG
jgi:dihydroorotate dehydrogenase electron transfer subunit